MKIVQALGWYLPESVGGTEIYVAGLAQRLRAAGHLVLVAAPESGLQGERTYEHEGIEVFRYPIPRRPSRAEVQRAVPVRGTERFHAWLERQRPEVVHFHTLSTGLGLDELRLAKTLGARVIVTSHESNLGYICQRGTMMHWGQRLCDGLCRPAKCAACELQHRGLPRWVAGITGAVPPRTGQWCLRLPGRLGTGLGLSAYIARRQAMQAELLYLADGFVVLTEWARQALLANGAPPEKVVLNRLGVSHQFLVRKPGPSARPTAAPVTVAFMGGFYPIKGVLDVVRALASLPPAVPLRLALHGGTSSAVARRTLMDVKRIVGPDPRVALLPMVAWPDIPRVLGEYDLVCCPSLCLEGGPTVALEALAVGTPVIGTRVGGLAETVTDGVNGKLVPPGDWQSLAATLSEVALDPRGTVDLWRERLPSPRTMDDIAADYLRLYARHQ